MVGMRRFVVIGQKAATTEDFSLDDLPASSGRLDVLLRCVRAALLVSHGLRRDTVIYLVLQGGARAPRTIKIDGATAEYVRPDERSLAGAIRSLLGRPSPLGLAFAESTRGVAIADGGLEAVIGDLGSFTPYVLDETASDMRGVTMDLSHPVFFVGDHLGFDEAARARFATVEAVAISVGPVSVHADDAIALVANELDRRMTERS